MNLEFRLPGAEPEVEPKYRPASEAELYDVIILGAGPAGATAAVYSARKGLNVLIITGDLGGQVLTTAGIENYSGFQYVTGPELAAKFKAQISQFPLALLHPAVVAKVVVSGENFAVTTTESRTYQGRSVIIASGAQPRQLHVPGENELRARGITYCATCDAPLYAGKTAAVVGGGNSALTSLLDLSPIARDVYAVAHRAEFKGDAIMIEKVKQAPNIHLLMNREPTRILGQQHVTGLELRHLPSGKIEQISVDGVFIEIGWAPNSDFVKDLVELNALNEIVVNYRNQTSVPGIFAAGDVTNEREKQIVIAAGEGAKAALAAAARLQARRRD